MKKYKAVAAVIPQMMNKGLLLKLSGGAGGLGYGESATVANWHLLVLEGIPENLDDERGNSFIKDRP